MDYRIWLHFFFFFFLLSKPTFFCFPWPWHAQFQAPAVFDWQLVTRCRFLGKYNRIGLLWPSGTRPLSAMRGRLSKPEQPASRRHALPGRSYLSKGDCGFSRCHPNGMQDFCDPLRSEFLRHAIALPFRPRYCYLAVLLFWRFALSSRWVSLIRIVLPTQYCCYSWAMHIPEQS